MTARTMRSDAPEDHREVRTRRVIQLAIHCLSGDVENAKAISRRFGVSMRTIYRDLRLLREAGLRIEPSLKGGYHFPRRYRLRCPQLEVADLAALRLLSKLVETSLSRVSASRLTQALDKVFLASIGEFRDKAEQITASCGEEIDSLPSLEAALEKVFTLLREAT